MGIGRTAAIGVIGVALVMMGLEAAPAPAKAGKVAIETSKAKRKVHARVVRGRIVTPPVSIVAEPQRPPFPVVVAAADYSYLDRANALAEAIGPAWPDTSFRYDDRYLHAWRTRFGEMMIAEPLRQGERRYFFAPGEHAPFLVTEPLHAFGYSGDAFVAGYDVRGTTLTAWMLRDFDSMAARLNERGRALYFAAQRERQDEAAAAARRAYGDGRQAGGTGAWQFGRADDTRWRYRPPERDRSSDDRAGRPRPAPPTAAASGGFAGPLRRSAGGETRHGPQTRDDATRTAANALAGTEPGAGFRETKQPRPVSLPPDSTTAPMATSGDDPTRRDARPRRDDTGPAVPLMVVPSANEPDGIGAAVPSPTRPGADAPVRTGHRAELPPAPSAIDEQERPAAMPTEAPRARDEGQPRPAPPSRPAAPSDPFAGRFTRDAPPQSEMPVPPQSGNELPPAAPVLDGRRQDAAPAADAKPEPDPTPSQVDSSDESSAVARGRTAPEPRPTPFATGT